MSPERYPPDDPREWLRLARGDALMASAEVPGAPLELFCFHAQQAAEKAIKAVLLAAGVQFPHTHDIDRLVDLLEGIEIIIPREIREAGFLTEYAVQTRYPLPSLPISAEEFTEAVARANSVLGWAETYLLPREPDGAPEASTVDAESAGAEE